MEDGRWPWGELPGGGSRDRLTGLYQSDAAQKQIAYCLSQLDEDSIPAVLLLNVDGFHHLNRRYGSLFGDAVLEELARALRRTFRRADVIARMGGDEFLIFLPSVSSAAVAGERAGRLLEACRSSAGRETALNALYRYLREQTPILPVCFKTVSALYESDVLEGLTPTAAEPFYDLNSCVIHLSAG